MYDYKAAQFIGDKNELFKLPNGISQAANLSSSDQEYYEYLVLLDNKIANKFISDFLEARLQNFIEIEAVNKSINEMRNTQLQTFLD